MNTRTRVAAAFAVVALLAGGGAAAAAASSDGPPANDPAAPAVDTGSQAAGPDAASSNCKKTYSSGAGITRFVWCFSNDGSVVQLEHSAGVDVGAEVDAGVDARQSCLGHLIVERRRFFREEPLQHPGHR